MSKTIDSFNNIQITEDSLSTVDSFKAIVAPGKKRPTIDKEAHKVLVQKKYYSNNCIYAITLLTQPNAKKHGRVGGRPVAMTEEKLRSAKSMLKDTDNYPFISDIIKTLGVGRTTFYRHYPPGKIDEIRNV